MKVVDGLTLPENLRKILRPGEPVTEPGGRALAFPRFFYEVPSWKVAKETMLTEHFSVAELMLVDCREAPELLEGPHHVPCAVTVLARLLEELRRKVGAPIFVAANGGYRSPGHQLATAISPHIWASAANVFRIGDTLLDNEKEIENAAQAARTLGPDVYARPYGRDPGQTDDHLHLDLGYAVVVPSGMDAAD